MRLIGGSSSSLPCWHLYRRFGLISWLGFLFGKENEWTMRRTVPGRSIDRSAVDAVVPPTSALRPFLTIHVHGHLVALRPYSRSGISRAATPGVTTWMMDKWSDEDNSDLVFLAL